MAEIIGIIIAAVILGYIIHVIIHPNTKNISDHFRGDDEKYE
jgi:hypothetical protein